MKKRKLQKRKNRERRVKKARNIRSNNISSKDLYSILIIKEPKLFNRDEFSLKETKIPFSVCTLFS